VLGNCKVTFRLQNNRPPGLYGNVIFSGPPFWAVSYDWWCDACVQRAPSGQLEFGLTNDLLLIVTGRRWCRSLAKVTKRATVEKSELKLSRVFPYRYNYLVSSPLSLTLFCQLSLIPETLYRASIILELSFVIIPGIFYLISGHAQQLPKLLFNFYPYRTDKTLLTVVLRRDEEQLFLPTEDFVLPSVPWNSTGIIWYTWSLVF